MKAASRLKITISAPCSEDFVSMPRTSCGMYCGRCEKEVIDFTALTDVELIDVFKRSPNACGLYRTEQLNKLYPIDVIPPKRTIKIWASILTMISFLDFTAAQAQIKINSVSSHIHHHRVFTSTRSGGKQKLKGRVLDSEFKPLRNVSIKIQGSDDSVISNAAGRFTLVIPNDLSDQRIKLIFHCSEKGYVLTNGGISIKLVDLSNLADTINDYVMEDILPLHNRESVKTNHYVGLGGNPMADGIVGGGGTGVIFIIEERNPFDLLKRKKKSFIGRISGRVRGIFN